MRKNGNLFIVATPIGNLADMTLRALEVLKNVDLIAAEDTRHSLRLLQHYGIEKPLISLHEHNEQQRIQDVLQQLQSGKNIALISDAGTPLISDPGYRLVHEMHQANITVIPIPGACAAISALVASGLPTDHFVFEGFLPVKPQARQNKIVELAEETRTIIIYEAPHRIENLFDLLVKHWDVARFATIARELTKTYETIRHDTLQHLHEWFIAHPEQHKGEWVILLAGAEPKKQSKDEQEIQRILTILLADLPLKQAVDIAGKITKIPRNQIYRTALSLKE